MSAETFVLIVAVWAGGYVLSLAFSMFAIGFNNPNRNNINHLNNVGFIMLLWPVVVPALTGLALGEMAARARKDVAR